MKWLFFGVAAILFFAIFYHNVIEFNQDLGRHLLTGKIIAETYQVPKVNLFSYTQPTYPFINSHWLSEVVFYMVSNTSGTLSLLYLKTTVMLATLLLALYTAYKHSKSLVATALAFVIFTPVLLERTEIRPEIFSYLFIAIFMYVLLLKPKFLWLLPIVEVVWVNMHIYFILGPILVAIYCLSVRKFSLSALLVFVAPLFNPNGLAGTLYPLQVFNNYGYSIVENQNIFFLRKAIFNPNIFYFGTAVVVFIVSFLFARSKLPAICYLLTALVVLPFIHIRSFPFLFLIELPVFAYVLSQIQIKETWKRWIIIVVVGITLVRSYRLVSNQYYLSIGSSKQFGAKISESGKGAVDFVVVNKLHGPLFNNFDIGSYLDYRLYPTEKVFVDGRPEAYPKEFFQNLYIPMQTTPENFSKVDEIFKFNLIIFSHTDGTPWGQTFLEDIVRNEKLELVYLDDYAIVLVRKGVFPEITKLITPPKNQLVDVDINSLILF